MFLYRNRIVRHVWWQCGGQYTQTTCSDAMRVPGWYIDITKHKYDAQWCQISVGYDWGKLTTNTQRDWNPAFRRWMHTRLSINIVLVGQPLLFAVFDRLVIMRIDKTVEEAINGWLFQCALHFNYLFIKIFFGHLSPVISRSLPKLFGEVFQKFLKKLSKTSKKNIKSSSAKHSQLLRQTFPENSSRASLKNLLKLLEKAF